MRGERGEITLVGLLVAMTLFLIVLGATLDVFASSERLNGDTQRREDAQDRARVAVDLLARQLRNLASPTSVNSQVVERATPRDLVFQTVNPTGPPTAANPTNVKRVRYCLDSSGRLWKQQQVTTITASPPTDGGTNCSAVGWQNSQVIADAIVNYASGLSRPVFSFNAGVSDITNVHVDLLVDLDPARPPAETRISTGVFLRNQNRAPTADFSWTPTVSQGLVLNGSLSVDPEGEPLTFCWYDAEAPTGMPAPTSPCGAISGMTYIGSGITLVYGRAALGSHHIQLVVWDRTKDGLSGQSAIKPITYSIPT